MNTQPEEINILFISYANIPFQAEIYASNLHIEWGDGNDTTFQEEQYLNISHTYSYEGLHSIRISGYGITTLDVPRLSLTALTLTHCPSLEYLNCAINELNSLDLTYCPVLEELHCNSNNLQKLNLSHNPQLQQINVSHNMLEQLDLSDCPALQSLYCSYNNLISIELKDCSLINNLDFCSNLLDKENLNKLFRELPAKEENAIICYAENPGIEFSEVQTLKSKKWN